MKDKILPFVFDAALVISFIASASFVMGSLYNFGYMSVFGLRSLVTSWDIYSTMFITWRFVVFFAMGIAVYYFGKTFLAYAIGHVRITNESAKSIIFQGEMILILAAFYFFADRSYSRGIQDARNIVSHPTEVTVVTNSALPLEQPLYFAAFGNEKYLLFSPAGPGRASLTTYVLPQSELRAMIIKNSVRSP